MSEHRKEVRQRTFLKGRILFNKGAASMDCLVRDMSACGARLSLSETSTLPDVFELYIPQRDKTYRATLAWRRHDGVGITFVDEAAPAPAPEPVDNAASLLALAHRVSELEAENATLRRLLTGATNASAGGTVHAA